MHKDPKEVREQAMQLSKGKVFQAEETASAKVHGGMSAVFKEY